MIDYSSRNFKKIVEKIQSEANGIRSLIAENEFELIIDWLIDNNVDGIILETMNNLDETQTILNILTHHSVPTYVSHYLAPSKSLSFTNQINNIITLSKNYDIYAL